MNEQSKRRWFRLRLRTWVVLACAGAVLGHLAWYARWKVTLERVKHEIAARGEPVVMRDLPRATQSEAAAAARFFTICERLPRTLPQNLETTLHANPPTLAADAEEIRALVEANRAAVTEIVELAHQGELHFPHDFDGRSGFAIPLPECDRLNVVQRLLTAQALLELDAHDSTSLFATILDKLAVADLLRREEFLVGQLARARDIDQTLDLLQMALAEAAPAATTCDALDRRLAALDVATRLATAVRAERATMLTMMENIGSPEVRQLAEMISSIGSGSHLVPGANAKCRYWGSPLYRPRLLEQQRWLLVTLGELADTIDDVGPAAQRRFTDQVVQAKKQLQSRPVVAWMFPATEQGRERMLSVRQRLTAARLGLRARAYFDAHGALPDSLDQLYDEQLDKPVGLLTGQPLNLARTSNQASFFDVAAAGEHFGEFTVTTSNSR
ncbi:MAG: hypothetical protein AB7O68_16640 [Pirellulales bacterium]